MEGYQFYADLHVHSKYSRATSRNCDLEHMAFWARKKGVSVLATGDFTHPAWFDEIQAKLVPAEPGLYRLRPDLERQVDEWLGGAGGTPVRFMLQVEISTIYKKDDRTRKVHHLIYVPDLAKAQKVRESLDRIGNIGSDGRPILGLDSRDLLEITLEAGEGCYLIPAHIWTPWFAVLGSKSGFDEVDHCYGDLTPHIFALETGLSSDPPMNWRLSRLDRYSLVSNSDAHSPPKIGREACVFDTEMDYFAMRRALETGEGYAGTVEFFPEEGKYHYDGHRKCGVCLAPEQSREHDGRCPVCGKPMTLGVMHRVAELADRPDARHERPPRAAPFRSLIPLSEVLSEIQGVGPQSKAVQRRYEDLLADLGSELFILERVPLEDVRRAGSPVLAEALARMREGRVIRDAGFDGQYGTIRLFTKEELRRGASVGLLFDLAEEETHSPQTPAAQREEEPTSRVESAPAASDSVPVNCPSQLRTSGATAGLPSSAGSTVGQANRGTRRCNLESPPADLDPEQRAAAEITHGPLLIIAGPGTGKTRTLTHRLSRLVADHGVPPHECLAITFTRRAAGEMRERLEALLGDRAERVPVMTFHALGLSILQEHGSRLGLAEPLRVASRGECVRLLQDALAASQSSSCELGATGVSPVPRQKHGQDARATQNPTVDTPQRASERKATRLLARFSQHKRRATAADADAPGSPPADEAETIAALAAYDERLRARGAVDFDDLVALPVRLLESHADLVDHYQARYRWISVDEYQDVDRLQYRLIRLLAPPDGNLCVIGDPDQAIYGFRGSDVSCFQRFGEDYPSARTISLARNYRSTRTIVDASLQVMEPASLIADRTLEALTEGPERIEIHECATDRAEAELVVHTIERMIGGHTFFSMDSGRVDGQEGEAFSFGDFAVLYRTDAQAEPLVEAFARSGIPFQKRSHDVLADQPGVQAVIQAMEDGPAGPSVLDRLNRAAEKVREDDPQVDQALPALRLLAKRHADDVSQFLSELALGVDVDFWDPRADRVALLTLHAAKGLEFPVVFIVGCEDGLIPLHWGSLDQADLAEERRLLFVGMTRAQDRLLLTHARKRRRHGKVQTSQPSPFLRDVEQQLLDRRKHRAKKKPAPQHQQRTLFEL
ncbi:MAG TPA: UvrD-helicase domain-containing protein [Thermoguttaceae bacterium]|nr:UvrD-helicase domain-containing protein [Thermoguttaceae bacterium]